MSFLNSRIVVKGDIGNPAVRLVEIVIRQGIFYKDRVSFARPEDNFVFGSQTRAPFNTEGVALRLPSWCGLIDQEPKGGCVSLPISHILAAGSTWFYPGKKDLLINPRRVDSANEGKKPPPATREAHPLLRAQSSAAAPATPPARVRASQWTDEILHSETMGNPLFLGSCRGESFSFHGFVGGAKWISPNRGGSRANGWHTPHVQKGHLRRVAPNKLTLKRLRFPWNPAIFNPNQPIKRTPKGPRPHKPQSNLWPRPGSAGTSHGAVGEVGCPKVDQKKGYRVPPPPKKKT